MYCRARGGSWNEPFYQGAGVPLLLTAWVPTLAWEEMRVGMTSGAEREKKLGGCMGCMKASKPWEWKHGACSVAANQAASQASQKLP